MVVMFFPGCWCFLPALEWSLWWVWQCFRCSFVFFYNISWDVRSFDAASPQGLDSTGT